MTGSIPIFAAALKGRAGAPVIPRRLAAGIGCAKQKFYLNWQNKIRGGVSPNSFVFWSTVRKDVPMRGQYFVNGLREALVNIGFTEDEAGKYDFHSWRHFYTSYMAAI